MTSNSIQTTILEIATFRPTDGLSVPQIVEAARASEEFCRWAPGIIRRSLHRNEDGSWSDHVEWADMDSALTASSAIGADPSVSPYFEIIQPDSVTMRHIVTHWVLDPAA